MLSTRINLDAMTVTVALANSFRILAMLSTRINLDAMTVTGALVNDFSPPWVPPVTPPGFSTEERDTTCHTAKICTKIPIGSYPGSRRHHEGQIEPKGGDCLTP